MVHKFLTSEDLIPFLKDNCIEFETVTHAPVFTVTALKEEMGKMPGLHHKNLFLRVSFDVHFTFALNGILQEKKTGNFYLLVTLHDRELKLNAVGKALPLTGKRSLRFASEEELMDTLGVRQGSVTVLALANDTKHCVSLLLDSAVLEEDDQLRWFHLMQNDVTAGLSRQALKKFFDTIEHQPTLLAFDPNGSVAIIPPIV